MSDRLNILVGTVSGTAEMVADELAAGIEDGGLDAKITRMDKASPDMLAAGGTWIICTSTYGTGDVPDNAAKLYAELGSARPDLSAVRYGVVALGDSIYPNTFCFGGRKFDELLSALGASRIGDVLLLDAKSGQFPDVVAAGWLEDWLPLL